jgi:NADH dehydrogenase FAD-containing subunit
VLAIGDCCVIDDKPLPANAQAASQQGFFLGRLLSKNVDFSKPIPERTGPISTPGEVLGVGEKRESGKIYAKGFQFLNLGTMAYTGKTYVRFYVSWLCGCVNVCVSSLVDA